MSLHKKLTASVVAVLFAFNSFCYGYDLRTEKLSPPLCFQTTSITPGSDDFKTAVFGDIRFSLVMSEIAEACFSGQSDLTTVLKETFRPRTYTDYSGAAKTFDLMAYVRETWGSFENLVAGISFRDNVVNISYAVSGQSYTVKIYQRSSFPDEAARIKGQGHSWAETSKYGFEFVPAVTPSGTGTAPETDKDMKGPSAKVTNPIIKKAIKEGKVVEISLFENNLVASYLKFLGTPENPYQPGTEDLGRLGDCISLKNRFTPEQLENIKAWLSLPENQIDNKPVRFRIVLGENVIGWDNRGWRHSNIAHAGQRDRAIYMGEYLFKYLFTNGQEDLQKELLDNDELQHLDIFKPNPHEDETRYRQRRHWVGNECTRIERLKEAMTADDWKIIRDYILSDLVDRPYRKDARASLRGTLSILNDISLSQYHYPVENRYPLLRAVAMMTKEEQNALVKFINRKENSDLRDNLMVVDSIMLMLEKKAPSDWIDKHAPHLIGKDLWQVSSEIWYPGGGLGRVMQFHGVGIYELLGEKYRSQLKHVEPYYHYQRNGQKMSYTDPNILAHPMTSEPQEIDMFTIKTGTITRTIRILHAVNDIGINCYFIDHIGSSSGNLEYTHSMYNWRDRDLGELRDGVPETRPTWAEFTEFLSKSSYTMIERFEAKEREARKDSWKPPLVHLNDSQLSLVGYAMLQSENIDDERFSRAANDPAITGLFKNPFKKENLPLLLKESFEGLGPAEPTRNMNMLKGMILASCYKEFVRTLLLASTTHTYINREATDFAFESQIPGKALASAHVDAINFREIFKVGLPNEPQIRDYASALLRFAAFWNGWTGAVSRKHRDDIHNMDEWWPNVDIIAVTNADHRATTASVFKEFLVRAAEGAEVDMDHPDNAVLQKAKQLAKKEFKLPKAFYASSMEADGSLLNPDQHVISYTGRFVPEKNGRTRALTDDNIIEYVKSGIQVVILGNFQRQDDRSVRDNDRTIALVKRISQLREAAPDKEKWGKFIYCNDFTQNEQRAIIAASDAGVLDSHPNTEAAGFSETDFAACGAIVIAPPWPNGEGIIVSQGTRINLDEPGDGNTLIPDIKLTDEQLKANRVYDDSSNDAKHLVSLAYRKTIIDFFSRNHLSSEMLSHYQATSMRFSRILEHLITASVYLTEWNSATERKSAAVTYGDDLLSTPSKYTSQYLEHNAALAGSVSNGLKTAAEILKSTDSFTYAEFAHKRKDEHDLKETTLRGEIRSLERLGILRNISRSKSQKLYTYTPEFAMTLKLLTFESQGELLDAISAMPELNAGEISEPTKVELITDKISDVIATFIVPLANSEDYRYIGISMGGNKLAISINDGSGNVIVYKELRWNNDPSFAGKKIRNVLVADRVMDRIVLIIRELIKEHNSRSKLQLTPQMIRFISAGIAGPVDNGAGIVGTDFKTPNLPFDQYPFRQTLAEKLVGFGMNNVWVDLINDGEAARNGEMYSPKGGLQGKIGGIVIIGGGINISVGSDKVKESGHNLIQVKEDEGTVHYAWVGDRTNGGHPIEAGNPLSKAEVLRKYGNKTGSEYINLAEAGVREKLRAAGREGEYVSYRLAFWKKSNGEFQSTGTQYDMLRKLYLTEAERSFKAAHPSYPILQWSDGCRDFEDSLSGPNIRRRAIERAEDVKRHNAPESPRWAEADRLEKAVADKSKFCGGFTYEAGHGNTVASELLKEIAREIGLALAAFIAHHRDQEFSTNLVLVSGVNENLGKGLYETADDQKAGLDVYMKYIRQSAAKELEIRFDMRYESISLYVNGIVRSEMTYERELVSHQPTDSERAAAFVASAVVNEPNKKLQSESQEMMDELHKINSALLPAVPDNKTLWHVIPIQLIPSPIRGKFLEMVTELNSQPLLKEKIKIVTERQDLQTEIYKLAESGTAIVDVAFTSADDLEMLTQIETKDKIKALVFEGEMGNFIQLEGIIASLRALQTGNVPVLLQLYEKLTGSAFSGSESSILASLNNPDQLAKKLTFILKPITIIDGNALSEMNKLLLEFIHSA